MTRLDRRVARRFARVLTVVAILALPIAATFGYAPAAASPGSAPELQAFTFTPNITAINFTVTPEATPIDTLEPQPSPTAEGESEDGEEVELGLGGGDWEIGYDFVETEDGGQWHIWMYGEVLVVESTDLELIALIGAFREQAMIRAQAKTDIEAAEVAMAIGAAGTFLGGIATLGSGIVTAASYLATPLTFVAGGGTGWLCVGGGLATISVRGLTAVSIMTGLQGFSNRSDGVTSLNQSSREAEQLFNSIRDRVYSQP